jgi:hypothetical protein
VVLGGDEAEQGEAGEDGGGSGTTDVEGTADNRKDQR